MGLEGCKVQISDSVWCGDMGPDGATCFHTLTSASRDLTKVQWDRLRFGMICTSGKTFADWKKTTEQLCATTGECDYETQVAIDDFLQKVETAKARAAAGRRPRR